MTTSQHIRSAHDPEPIYLNRFSDPRSVARSIVNRLIERDGNCAVHVMGHEATYQATKAIIAATEMLETEGYTLSSAIHFREVVGETGETRRVIRYDIERWPLTRVWPQTREV